MNKNSIFGLTLIIIAAIGRAYPQVSRPGDGYTPPSPHSMSFMKYGEYPVDHATGVPEINIPLYSIDLGDYSFPISARFHASGRKVSLNFSPLGMNWLLDAYGMISKEIKGKADNKSGVAMDYAEKPAAYYEPDSPVTRYSRKESYVKMLHLNGDYPSGPQWDGEYDQYTVSIHGISAKFIIRNNRQILFLTAFPYELNNSSGNFVLTDDRGIKYEFGASSDTDTYGARESFSDGSGISAWLIRQITTPVGRQIKFRYNSVMAGSTSYALSDRTYSERATFGDDPHLLVDGRESTTGYERQLVLNKYNEVYQRDYRMAYLTAIEYDFGKILFTSDPTNLLLKEITLQDPKGATLRTVSFHTGTFQTNANALNLPNNNSKTVADITFKDGSGRETEKYGFEYYTTGGDPSTDLQAFGMGKDLWGYANGNQRQDIIPVDNTYKYGGVPIAVGSSSSRAASFLPKLAGMIKKISYPTGGQSEFVYEENKYSDAGMVKSGPGIRISKITNTDGVGLPTIHEYKYGSGESGAGTLLWKPGELDFQTVQYITPYLYGLALSSSGTASVADGMQYRWRVFSSEPLPVLESAYRLPVYYDQVSEYVYSTGISASNGKTVYQYSTPTAEIPNMYVSFPDGRTSDGYYFQRFVFNEWSQPYLQNKKQYKRESGGTYKLLSEERYVYERYKETVVPQTSVYRLHRVEGSGPVNGGSQSSNEVFVATESSGSSGSNSYRTLPWSVLNVLQYNLNSAIMKPTVSAAIQYLDNGTTLETNTIYRYDNLDHMNPTRTETTKSDGKKQIFQTSYPGDYRSGTAFIDDMNTHHLIGLPIEQVTYKQSGTTTAVLSGILTKYETGGKGLVDEVQQLETNGPVVLSTFKFSNRATGQLPPSDSATTFSPFSGYKARLKYNSYDSKGNLLQYTQKTSVTASGPSTSYQWGYNGQYPTVNIINAENNRKETYTNRYDVRDAYNYSTFSITPARSNLSFNTSEVGDIVIALSGINSEDWYADCTLNGPDGQKAFRLLSVQSGINYLLDRQEPWYRYVFAQLIDRITLSNMPKGTYDLAIYVERKGGTGAVQPLYVSYREEYLSRTDTLVTGVDEFYYQGFEESEGTTTVKPYAGQGCYAGDYRIPAGVKLSTTRKYLIDYRYYDGGIWSYMKKVYTAGITLSEGTAIDEVRIYPVDAQMTTYTYDPLIGMTSMTDPGGKTTFYEYDGFQRLKAAKDQEGKIIETYDYHYKQP